MLPMVSSWMWKRRLRIAPQRLSPPSSWSIASRRTSISLHGASSGIRPTVRHRCWPGWSMRRLSNHTSPFGIGLSAKTAPSLVAISSGIERPMNTAAQQARVYVVIAAPSIIRAAASPKPRRSYIEQASATAQAAQKKHGAARIRRCAKLPGASMRMPGMWLGASPRRRNISSHAVSARRWRCYLPTSSGFSGWTGYVYVASAGPAMNSHWRRPFRICADWPSWPVLRHSLEG